MGSCSVSERPADGGAAEFSRGLVPATLAEGRGAGGKPTKQEGDFKKEILMFDIYCLLLLLCQSLFLLELVELKLKSLKKLTTTQIYV